MLRKWERGLSNIYKFKINCFSQNNAYNITNHTLTKYLYLFPFYKDNIGYILHEPSKRELIGFDFGEFNESKKFVERLESRTNSRLRHLFITHSHDDHCGGNKRWKEERKDELTIYSGDHPTDHVPFSDKKLKDLETLTIGEFCIASLETPGHKKSHVCYIVTHVTPVSTKIPILFCGDLLFIGGCGRVLDGTYEELYESLRKISYLPHETLIYCGHEYTQKNLEFIQKLDPKNPIVNEKIEWCKEMRSKGEFTVGSRLIEEKLYNPFMRSGDKYYLDLLGEKNEFICFKKLRLLKDNFK